MPNTAIPSQLIIDLTQTDLPVDTPVYVYVVGLVGSLYYYMDANGAPQLMSLKDNTQTAGTFPDMDQLSPAAQDALSINYPLDWADWSMAVSVGSNLILPLGNINTTTIPTLGTGTQAFSGRVYFSVGVPRLPFTVQGSGNTVTGYTAPVFGNGTGVGGSLCLYDWIEFSYDSEGNFNGNPTQVNQFGFPIWLQATPVGESPYPTQGQYNSSRSHILQDIANMAAPCGGTAALIAPPAAASEAYPSSITYLRGLSPDTLSGSSQPPATLNAYFDTVIQQAAVAWQTTPLVTTDLSTGSYTGVVYPLQYPNTPTAPTGYPAGALAFYAGRYTMAELATALQATPVLSPAFFISAGNGLPTSSADIWQCANSLASGGTAQLNVGKMLAAAFNRGMIINAAGTVTTSLDDSTCASEANQFYADGTCYNPWAEAFHSYSANGLAYGFPYDDVCDQNPSVPPAGDSLVASFVRLTLGCFYH